MKMPESWECELKTEDLEVQDYSQTDKSPSLWLRKKVVIAE